MYPRTLILLSFIMFARTTRSHRYIYIYIYFFLSHVISAVCIANFGYMCDKFGHIWLGCISCNFSIISRQWQSWTATFGHHFWRKGRLEERKADRGEPAKVLKPDIPFKQRHNFSISRDCRRDIFFIFSRRSNRVLTPCPLRGINYTFSRENERIDVCNSCSLR